MLLEEVDMKIHDISEKKLNAIIETFSDYVENYFDEANRPEDTPVIVDTHFDEFVDWAYDDFLLDDEDRVFLKDPDNKEIRSHIKREVTQHFQGMLKAM